MRCNCSFLPSSSVIRSRICACTVFRCWPSSPSSSPRGQSWCGIDSRAASCPAWLFRRSIGRSSRLVSTPASTATPNSTCTATSAAITRRRSASWPSISVPSKVSFTWATTWPSCSTGESSRTTARLPPQWSRATVIGVAVAWLDAGCRPDTSMPQTEGSPRMRSAAWSMAGPFSDQAGSVSAAAACARMLARLRWTTGSCVWRATCWSTTSSASAGSTTPTTMAVSTMPRIDSVGRRITGGAAAGGPNGPPARAAGRSCLDCRQRGARPKVFSRPSAADRASIVGIHPGCNVGSAAVVTSCSRAPGRPAP